MIHCLTGEVIYIDALSFSAVIDCGGVGYKVSVSANTLPKLTAAEGKKTRVYTHMQVRDDGIELFGFYDTDELEAFKMLITVSGVGPKAALAILSVLTPEALSAAIAADDSKAISRAQGVGGKIAARVVLELKEKFTKAFPVSDSDAATVSSKKKIPTSASPSPSKLSDARDALLVLGYTAADSARALGNIDTGGDVEDIIRRALAYLLK